MQRKDIVVAIAHASVHIPEDIRSRMVIDDHAIRNEADLYADELYNLHGTRIVQSEYSRIVSDVNRAPDEMYYEGHNRSVGVAILTLPSGETVFANDPTLQETEEWVSQFHTPFHTDLQRALHKASFVLDAHTMSSEHAPGHFGLKQNTRPDISLGNHYYCSCSAETTRFFRDFFEDNGYSVLVNDPYPGRYILGTYCNRFDIPGITVEVNKKLYLNEETLEPYPDAIANINAHLSELIDAFCTWNTKRHGERDITDLTSPLEEE